MKSITLAAVVALLAGGTALGVDTSTIAYELELGGNNHLADWEQGFPPPPLVAFTPGAPDDYPAGNTTYAAGDIITWDARVMASGQKDDATANYISGATNLEFSLEIRKDAIDGLLEAEAIFFSTMNDGDADPAAGGPDDPLEMAAFCHIFNVPCPMRGWMVLTCPDDGRGPAGSVVPNGPGRAYDVYASGGPEMDRAQFPSVALGRIDPLDADVLGPHPGGRLTGADPAGHKLAGGAGVVDPVKLPDMAGKLVGMGVGYSQFTYAADSGNTAGVGIDPAVNGGYGGVCYRGLGQHAIFEGQIDTRNMAGTYYLNLVPGANNNVMPGALDCSASQGHFAEPAATVLDDSIIFYVAPESVGAWRSVREHPALSANWLAIELDASASGSAVVSETRRYGIQMIEADVTIESGTCSLIATIQAENLTDGGFISATSQGIIDHGGGSYTVWAEWTQGLLPDLKCYEIDLAGKTDCTLIGDTDCRVRGLVGDTNGDENTNLIDMAQTKSKNGQPLLPDNIRFDVNTDASVNLIDMALVKSLNGRSCICP